MVVAPSLPDALFTWVRPFETGLAPVKSIETVFAPAALARARHYASDVCIRSGARDACSDAVAVQVSRVDERRAVRNQLGGKALAARRLAVVAHRLDETVSLPLETAYRRFTAVNGVGPWTAARIGLIALGDPDAVTVGDLHIPHMVTWALAGERRGSDERMLELLEPFRGHRGRVIRLLMAG